MIADIQYAAKCATVHKNHVAMVVPQDRHMEALNLLVAIAGTHPMGGRSVVFPSGGQLSVMNVKEAAFEEPFDVMFTGWGQVTMGAEEMTRWRKAASQVVSRVV